jgi:hypothetical protein
MTFLPNQMMDAHRAAKRLAFSCSPHQVFQELFDNGIQYNATEVGVFLDDVKDLFYVYDNGDGMDLKTFQNKYHTLYAKPNNSSGISSNGVGSKTFKKFSDIRIALTRDKKAGMMYYSIWDTSNALRFQSPHISILRDGQVPSPLQKWDYEVKVFLNNEDYGTMVIVPEIQNWPSFSSQGKAVSFSVFKRFLQERLQKRYQHLLATDSFDSISLGWNQDNKRNYSKLYSDNILENIDLNYQESKTIRYDSTGQFRIITWEPDTPSAIQTGTIMFRNNIRFDSNEKTYKLSKRKDYAIANSPNKRIRQAVFWDSPADEHMSNINPWKTTAEFGSEVALILAQEYSALEETIKERNKAEAEENADSPVVIPTIGEILETIQFFVDNSTEEQKQTLINQIAELVNKGEDDVAA